MTQAPAPAHLGKAERIWLTAGAPGVLALVSPEAQFSEFRDRRDMVALGEVLLDCAPRLRAIARRARSRTPSENIVQMTFVRAIEHAHEFDADRSLMSWLAGILTNVVREERRRYHFAASNSCDSIDGRAADPVARAIANELESALQLGLSSLPSHYRETVALRLIDGLGAKQISERQGQPVATVRARLQRGLRLLRRQLPYGLSALATLGAAQAKTPSRAIPKSKRSWLALTTTAAAILVAVLACVGWSLSKPERSPRDATPLRSASAASTPQHETPVAASRRRVETTGFEYRGRFDTPPDTSWDDATVVAFAGSAADPHLSIAEVAADWDRGVMPGLLRRLSTPTQELARASVRSDGSFTLRDVPARQVRLTLVDPTRALAFPHVVRVEESQTHEPIRWYRGGRVFGNLGTEWAGATVVAELGSIEHDERLEHLAWKVSDRTLLTHVDDDGAFELRAVPPCSHVDLWVRSGDRSAFTRTGAIHVGATLEARPEPGPATLTVHAVDAAGRSVPGASIRLHWLGNTTVNTRADWVRSAGLARFEGLPSGVFECSASARGRVATVTRIELRPGHHTISLPPAEGVPIRGRLVDGNARPLANLDIRGEGIADRTDADGRFQVFAARLPTPIRFTCAGVTHDLIATSSELGELRLMQAIELRVFDRETSRPIERFEVAARTGDGAPVLRRTVFAVDGRTYLDDLPVATTHLSIVTPGYAESTIAVSDDAVSTELVAFIERYAVLRGTVRDNRGDPIADAVVWQRDGSTSRMPINRRSRTRSDAHGRYELSMRPGRCVVDVEGEDGGLATAELMLDSGSVREHDLRLDPPARIRGSVPSAPIGTQAVLVSQFGRCMRTKVTNAGFELSGIGAGSYTLLIETPGTAFAPRITHAVSLAPGATVDVGILEFLESHRAPLTVFATGQRAVALEVIARSSSRVTGPTPVEPTFGAELDIEPGEWILELFESGSSISTPRAVTIAAETPTVATLEVGAASIDGHVIAPAGIEIVEVNVGIAAAGQSAAAPVTVDVIGGFEHRGLTRGTFQLTARARDANGIEHSAAATVTVGSELRAGPIELRLAPRTPAVR